MTDLEKFSGEIPDGPWAIVMEQPIWYEPENLLKAKLRRVGLDPEQARVVYVFPETPESTSLTAQKEQMPRLKAELEDVSAALLLGGTALQAIGGQTSITKNRGTLKALRKEMTGLEHVDFLSTLHPSVVLRTPNYTAEWVKDLAAFQQLVNPPEDNDTIVLIDSEAKFKDFLEALRVAERGALDIETTVPENDRYWESELITVSVCFDDKTAWVLAFDGHPEKPAFTMHRSDQRFFLDQFNKIEWIMHNGLFDRLVLRELSGGTLDPKLAHDTMAMAYLLHEDERKGLEILSSVYLGEPPYKGVDYKTIKEEPLEKIAEMNGKDTLRTFRLYRPLADEMNGRPELSRIYQWLLMPAINALIRCTENGVPVDRERLDRLTEAKATAEVEALQALQALAPDPDPELYPDGWPKHKDEAKDQKLNPASPQQMSHVLYDLFGMPVLKTTDTGNPSTDADTLTQLAPGYPPGTKEGDFMEALLTYRGVSKQLSSYLQSWPKVWRDHTELDTRLHPRYKPLHVVTGRLSSSSPNIQNVPRDKEYRSLFGGVPGYTWLKADYSQLELRIGAWMAQEQTMLQAYQDGEDLHALTARTVLGVTDVTQEYKPGTTARDVGKTLNFGLLYGAYPKTLARIARMNYGFYLAEHESEDLRERFFHLYPGLERWHGTMERTIRRSGQSVSPLGRVRHLPDALSDEFKDWSTAVREGTNHPVQSFGSDLLLMSLVRVQDWIDQNSVDATVVAEVHDEIDLLVKDESVEYVADNVRSIMQDISWLKRFNVNLTVPVLADIETGPYWGELE